jgi:hypothetical protein
MSDLLAFLPTLPPVMLATLGALAVLGLQGWVIYLLVKARQQQETIATNHLHDLPEMVEILRRMETRQHEAARDMFTLLREVRDMVYWIKVKHGGNGQ